MADTKNGDIVNILENFKGVQYKSTGLTAPPNYFLSLQNMQFNNGFSLEGRKGQQLLGQRGFHAITNYTYQSTVDGSTMTEVIAANEALWKLTQYTFTITYVAGSTSYGWKVRWDDTAGQFQFILVQGGSNYFVQNLGHGFEDNPYSVYDLVAAINATANFNCTVSGPSARVNGTQVFAGPNPTITVTSGTNTAQVGDYVCFFNYANQRAVDVLVTARTATSLTISYSGAVEVRDLQRMGQSVCAAATLSIQDLVSTTASTLAVPFQIFRRVASSLDNITESNSNLPFYTWLAQYNSTGLSSGCRSFCFINAQQGLYCIAPAKGYIAGYEGRLYKYDGRFVYRAGMTGGSAGIVTDNGGGAVGTNYYKFIHVIRYRDYKGIIVEGRASTPLGHFADTAPFGAGPTTVTVSPIDHPSGFNTAGARVNGAGQTVPGTINVDFPHQLQVGDTVFFQTTAYNGYNSGDLPQGTITARTSNTITISNTPAATLIDNGYISSGIVHRVYRTKLNGIKYYLAGEAPNDPTAVTVTVNCGPIESDTFLSLQYDEPEIGQEPDAPPRGITCGCIHDGGMVLANLDGAPNSFVWSAPSNIEHFPAENNAVVPSAVPNGISAVISERAERLIIGKDGGVYAAIGSLVDNNFSVQIVTEFDRGLSAPGSTIKWQDKVFGVSSRGITVIEDGKINDTISLPIDAVIQNTRGLEFQFSWAVNDTINNLLKFFIPQTRTVGNAEPNATGDLTLVWDYENGGIWFDWYYPQGFRPSGGFAVSSGFNYHASNGSSAYSPYTGRVFKELNLAIEKSEGFIDHNEPISYGIRTFPYHNTTPDFDKLFVQFKMWSIFNPFDEVNFIPFTVRIRTYRDFQRTVLYNDTTETFSSLADFERIVGLMCEARAVETYITCGTRKQRPRFTGIGYNIHETQRKANFRK